MDSLSLLKEVREISGAGVQDCQNAVREAQGDKEKALLLLRQKGMAKAAKRNDRVAGEGVIMVWADDARQNAFLLEMTAETDFVIKSERFNQLAQKIFSLAKEKSAADLPALLALPLDGQPVSEHLQILSGVIGEKISLSRYFKQNTTGTLAVYAHAGGKIAALAVLSAPNQKDLAFEIAMQVAAANPLYISSADVPADIIAKEKDIYRAQLAAEGKPAQIQEKIIDGKLNKYFSEFCLLEQEYIKEEKKKVKEILDTIKVESFTRWSLV